MPPPVFYYDISSAYAYLAAERIEEILPNAEWRPILLGGLFKLNGRTSWLLSDEREARMAEIEERARRYGLPPVSWPTALPSNLLALARAATVAKRGGRETPFALEGFRTLFVHGRDPSSPEELRRLGASAGLEPDQLVAAIGDQSIKDELRTTTEEAHAAGVPGVPTIVVGEEVFWGDDRLDDAATAAIADRIRLGYERFNRRDWDAIARGLPDDFEAVDRVPVDELTASGPRALELITKANGDTAFADLKMYVVDVETTTRGEGEVVAAVRITASASGGSSGAPVEGEIGQVWTFRDGIPRRFEQFGTWEEARQAAAILS